MFRRELVIIQTFFQVIEEKESRIKSLNTQLEQVIDEKESEIRSLNTKLQSLNTYLVSIKLYLCIRALG